MQCRNGNTKQAKRLITLPICALVLSLSTVAVDLCAESNQASPRQAVLHINVVVMPVVQAINLAPPLPRDGTVVYSLQTAPLEKKYEMRPLPRDKTAQDNKQGTAILKTLLIVPE